MNFFKTASLLIIIASSISVSAQQNEPVILEVKKGNDKKTVSNEKAKYFVQFGIMSRNHDSLNKNTEYI